MSPDIRELFDEAADDSGRSHIDAQELLNQGRHKVRRRRAGAAAGAAAVAVVAAIGLSQIPSLTSTGPLPPADTPTVTLPTQASSGPTPGSPTPDPTSPSSPTGTPESASQTSGAELLKKLTYAEGVRRCKARMLAEYGDAGTPDPGEPLGPGEGLQYGMYVTDLLPMELKNGQRTYCSVPGTVRPSYDETPGETPGDARKECGRLTWTNPASWIVAEQRDSTGGLAATLLSNDGQAVLLCDIDGPGATRDKVTAFPNAYVYLVYGPNSGQRVGAAPNGHVGSGLDSTPIHWLGSVRDGRQFWGGGGIAAENAVRYALFAGDRKLAEAPVRYGVYALRVWLPAGVSEPTQVRVYDAAGKVIDQYMPF